MSSENEYHDDIQGNGRCVDTKYQYSLYEICGYNDLDDEPPDLFESYPGKQNRHLQYPQLLFEEQIPDRFVLLLGQHAQGPRNSHRLLLKEMY
jgi:hypothetical protein